MYLSSPSLLNMFRKVKREKGQKKGKGRRSYGRRNADEGVDNDGNLICFACGSRDHFARQCDQNERTGNRRRKRATDGAKPARSARVYNRDSEEED